MLKDFRYFAPLIPRAQIILGILSLLSPAAVLANSIPEEQPEQISQISSEHQKIEPSLGLATKIGESITEHQSQDMDSTNLAEVDSQTPQPSLEESPTETLNFEQQSDQWHFKIQPYATIPITTYGNATVKGRTVDYHQDLGDILETLRVTASGRVEAWHNDLGFIIDAYYVSLNGGGIKTSPRSSETSLQSTLTFDQGIYDFALSYHLGAPAMYSLPEKPSKKTFPQIWFEPIAGVRLNALTSSINNNLTFGRIDRSFEKTFNGGRTWFEPMIGGKIGVQISDPVTLWVRGDVSGFGLAGDTDLSWNIIAGADWWVTQTVSLQLGYRFYEINYRNGTGNNAFGLEESFNGPYLSATFNF